MDHKEICIAVAPTLGVGGLGVWVMQGDHPWANTHMWFGPALIAIAVVWPICVWQWKHISRIFGIRIHVTWPGMVDTDPDAVNIAPAVIAPKNKLTILSATWGVDNDHRVSVADEISAKPRDGVAFVVNADAFGGRDPAEGDDHKYLEVEYKWGDEAPATIKREQRSWVVLPEDKYLRSQVDSLNARFREHQELFAKAGESEKVREQARLLKDSARDINRLWPSIDFSKRPMLLPSWIPNTQSTAPAWLKLARDWHSAMTRFVPPFSDDPYLQSLNLSEILDFLDILCMVKCSRMARPTHIADTQGPVVKVLDYDTSSEITFQLSVQNAGPHEAYDVHVEMFKIDGLTVRP
ncbi:MAG: hypothetical protein ABSH50_23630, partial [Bryobacteraceae bacterium]